jgi:hypothetical protein
VDARPLDVFAHDLPGDDVERDQAFDPFAIDVIIQGRDATRARERREARTDRYSPIERDELADEDVWPLRAATEAALPHHLALRARVIGIERVDERVVQHGRAATVAALGPTADDDAELPRHAKAAYEVRREISKG